MSRNLWSCTVYLPHKTKFEEKKLLKSDSKSEKEASCENFIKKIDIFEEYSVNLNLNQLFRLVDEFGLF